MLVSSRKTLISNSWMSWMCIFSQKRPTQRWALAPHFFFCFLQAKPNSAASLALSCLSSSPGSPAQCCILSRKTAISCFQMSLMCFVFFFFPCKDPVGPPVFSGLTLYFFPGKPQYSTLAQHRLPRSILTIFFSINPQYPTPKQPMLPSSELYFSQKTPKNQAFHCREKKKNKKVLVGRCWNCHLPTQQHSPPRVKIIPGAGRLQELRPGW